MATNRRTSKQSSDADDSAETLRGLYEQMVLVREFELKASEMYARAKIGGYCHLNLGEEATVVGLMAALQERDYLFTTYRDHGYAIIRGMSPGAVMAELFGRVDGVVGGRGGSMHMFDSELRMLGGYGIVGGQIPPATGAALAVAYRSEPAPDAEAVMCLLGDGTVNIGAFHESLNLAGIWNLPIVYVIVNNRLGMGTTVEAASAEPDLYKRGAAYRIPGVRVDGDDPIAVRDAALTALEQARVHRQPQIVETMSYRLKGHSVVDPAKYRSDDDHAEARSNDPVPEFRAKLLKKKVLDKAAADSIQERVEQIVADAVAFADASPHPDPQELFRYSWATPVANASTAYPGDPVMAS
jgi:pyruvate dehydrogenase E1 component alpha subunit